MENRKSLLELLHAGIEYPYVSQKNRIIYIPTAKAACTSLKWWLMEMEGYSVDDLKYLDSFEVSTDLKIHDCILQIAPYLRSSTPDKVAAMLTSGDYFTFCMVRNPYTRIFSAWQSKILLQEPLQIQEYKDCGLLDLPINNVEDIANAFENFLSYIYNNEFPNITNPHWKPMVELLQPDIMPYTKIYQLEHSDQMTIDLQKKFGSDVSIPLSKKDKFNDSIIPFSPVFFTDKAIEIIETLYKNDFTRFGYNIGIPEASTSFTKEQFDTYKKAIHMLRSRHRRIEEILNLKNELTLIKEMLNKKTALTFTKKLYASEIKRCSGKEKQYKVLSALTFGMIKFFRHRKKYYNDRIELLEEVNLV